MSKGFGLFLILIFLSSQIYAQAPTVLLSHDEIEQQIFSLERLQPYNGLTIHEIHIHGLYHTKEKAVRWLLSQHEGDVFSAEQWLIGIHKLYDTSVLYDIITTAIPVQDPSQPHQIDIEIQLNDRWTLMPFGIAQAGGGSSDLGGGVYEANLFGYFGQVSASYNVFDNVASYDVNYFQEFFRDTDYIMGADVSGTGTPISLQANNGNSLGTFTWFRQQEQLLFGRKLSAAFEPKIRLFSYFEYFQDHMVTNSGAPEVHVFHEGQYRVRPVLILGRSELTNFLEQGQELTFLPTAANFFSSKLEYYQLVMTYKKVFLQEDTNYAIFFNTGAMSKAPIPYLFHLGGYDTVRGFSTTRTMGRYYVADSLEYRPYLFRFHLPILGEITTQGNVFTDGGLMWDSADLAVTRHVNSDIFLLSAGTGVRLDFLRFAGCIVRMDLAKTITPNEGWGLSMGVGQFF